MLFLFYECGMRMRPRCGAKLVIITWREDVLKWGTGQLAAAIRQRTRAGKLHELPLYH